MKTTKYIGIIFGILSWVMLPGCSSDNADKPGKSANDGQFEVTVSGDISNDYSGSARFFKIEDYSWVISMNVTDPDSDSDYISVEIDTGSLGLFEGKRPAVGEYPIDCGLKENHFMASFNKGITGGEGYSTFYVAIIPAANCAHKDPGVLTIESSSENKVTGSFSFRAYQSDIEKAKAPDYLPPITGEVAVSGTFTAYKVDL